MSKNTPANDDEFEELRHLLLGPELEKLGQLTKRLESPEQFSSDISDVLPQAMLKSAQHGEKLTEAMVPTVEDIVRLSIKRDIDKFASALFPVIGPAIRKSISETIREMLQSLNQVLEHGLSWQGLKWRLESMRTGIPFAQIVMLNSLEYRVEQVFLIHRDTGLLLNHVQQTDSISQNADMVSSMLSAIRDFVGDSFDVENRQELDSIQVGDFSIFIEQGPDAILAVASRGNAPNSLRNIMSEVLENIQSQLDSELTQFTGDTAAFDSCKEQLLLCLTQSQQQKERGKLPLNIKLIWFAVFLLLFYWIVATSYQSIQQKKYVSLLEQEPGFIITQVLYDGEKLSIKGLKDPLARDPLKFAALTSLNPDDLNLKFEPYHSLEKQFVEKRVFKILQLPETVSIDITDGILTLKGYANVDKVNNISIMAPLIAGIDQIDKSDLKSSVDLSSLKAPDTVKLSYDSETGVLTARGSAQSNWRIPAREKALKIAGINSYDDSQLKNIFDFSILKPPKTVEMMLQGTTLIIRGEADNHWIKSVETAVKGFDDIQKINYSELLNTDKKQLELAIQSLQEEIIFFDVAASFNYNASDSLNHVTQLVNQIINSANILSLSVQIIVKGHSDSIGLFEDNVYLSLKRADYVAQYLINTGISPKYILIKGIDAPVPKEINAAEQRYNRRVSFTVQVQ